MSQAERPRTRRVSMENANLPAERQDAALTAACREDRERLASRRNRDSVRSETKAIRSAATPKKRQPPSLATRGFYE